MALDFMRKESLRHNVIDSFRGLFLTIPPMMRVKWLNPDRSNCRAYKRYPNLMGSARKSGNLIIPERSLTPLLVAAHLIFQTLHVDFCYLRASSRGLQLLSNELVMGVLRLSSHHPQHTLGGCYAKIGLGSQYFDS